MPQGYHCSSSLCAVIMHECVTVKGVDIKPNDYCTHRHQFLTETDFLGIYLFLQVNQVIKHFCWSTIFYSYRCLLTGPAHPTLSWDTIISACHKHLPTPLHVFVLIYCSHCERLSQMYKTSTSVWIPGFKNNLLYLEINLIWLQEKILFNPIYYVICQLLPEN